MKLPKFIKNSAAGSVTPSAKKLNTSTLLAMSQNQLLLTDEICRFQPQKQRKSNIINKENTGLETPNKKKQQQFIDSNSFLFVKSDTPNDNKTPKTQTPKLIMFPNACNSTSATSNLCQTPGSGRYAKTTQPKRLQRNRLQHVTSKPSIYELRSSVLTSSTNKPNNFVTHDNNNKDCVDFIMSKSEVQKLQLQNQQQQTPIRGNPISSLQPFSKTTPQQRQCDIMIEASSITNTPQTAAKPQSALSKLSKFVSKSALKVMNHRKSLDSKMKIESSSTGSSPSTSSNSSSNTSMISDDLQPVQFNSVITSNNDYNYIDERIMHLNNNQQDSEPKSISNAYNSSSIYHSLEQEEVIKQKLNQQSKLSNLSGFDGRCRVNKPVMGVASLMLKQYKKSLTQHQYGLTTGVFSNAMPSVYLIGIPAVFQSSNDSNHNYSTSSSNSNSSNNTYDHLTRVQQASQSSSSIELNKKETNNSTISSSKLSNNFNSNLQTQASLTPPSAKNNCRITVFSGQPSSIQSASTLSASLNTLYNQTCASQYDSAITETVF